MSENSQHLLTDYNNPGRRLILTFSWVRNVLLAPIAESLAFVSVPISGIFLLAVSPALSQTQTPHAARRHLDKGVAELRVGHIDHAIAEFTKAIESAGSSQPDSSKNGRGKVDQQVSPDGFARSFRSPVAPVTRQEPVSVVDPFTALAYYDRGVAYVQKNDIDSAIRDFDRAIRTNPLLVDAYSRRGAALHAKGDDSSAIKDFDRAILIDPRNASDYSNRGICRESAGDVEGALADFAKAINLDPNLVSAYCNRGAARCNTGDLDGAIADLDIAVRLSPASTTAYNNRARAREEKGDLDGAIADYDRALALDPSYALAFAGRGLTELKLGKASDAKEDLDEAIALAPQLKPEIDRYIELIKASVALRRKPAQAEVRP